MIHCYTQQYNTPNQYGQPGQPGVPMQSMPIFNQPGGPVSIVQITTAMMCYYIISRLIVVYLIW